MGLIVSDEANGIEWLKMLLKEPKTYQEISPDWMQAVNGLRKGDVLPELKDILEENFIEDETGHWHVPDLEKQIDLEKAEAQESDEGVQPLQGDGTKAKSPHQGSAC